MRVEIHEEVQDDGLCFQYCTYHWDDREPSKGYRFIWRDDRDKLIPARGQAIIHDQATLLGLLAKAAGEGWFK